MVRRSRIGTIVKILLIFWGLFLSTVFIEFIGRFFPRVVPEFVNNRRGILRMMKTGKDIFTYHPYLGIVCKPNIDVLLEGHPDYIYRIKTVSLGDGKVGFRDDGLQGEPFAVGLGDSFTFAVGVDMCDGWVELLEKYSKKDFLNLSGSGHCPSNYIYGSSPF